jgi:hypothetical protein|tara:strand:+ start:42 stop:389 length:348 start_codon:yes stop_codon:yes gene_type:complete
MTEYQKLESLHWGLDELIQGNELTDHELKTLQSFVEDIREKHFESEDIIMADQTSNEISHVQSVNKGREHVRKQINSDLDVSTQVTIQKRQELVGVEQVKKEIHLFFTTPFDKLK